MVQCDAGSSSRFVDNDCGCHLLINDATVEKNNYGLAVKVQFYILASDDADQIGKTFTELFSCEKGVDKLYNVAEAIGVITPEQRRAAAEAGVGLDIDETQFKGRHLCGQIQMEGKVVKNANGEWIQDPTDSRKFPKCGFNTFGVNSSKAKKIPKDQQFIQSVASAAGGAAPVQQGEQPQSQSTADMSMNF